MKPQTVVNKLNSIAEARRASVLKRAKYLRKSKHDHDTYDPKAHAERMKAEATRIKPTNVLDLNYRVKRNVFVNYKESCVFNPTTYLGHSYRWYELTKDIRGVVVLNTFSYSIQTAKHIRKVSSVMRDLGIKYRTLEAPKGLQDLDAALAHACYIYGTAVIAERHARIKSRYAIRYAERQLSLLKKLGKRATKSMLNDAISKAEASRASRLKEARRKRFRRELERYLENDLAFRDYEIGRREFFGDSSYHLSREIAVHQIVDRKSMESDVENALHSFQRDGFSSIVFYI